MANYWYRLKRGLEGCRPRLAFGLCLFEEGFSFDLFGFLISLPFLDRLAHDPYEIMESWRCLYFERSVHLHWGRHCKIVRLPWDYEHIKHEVMRPDGSWVPAVGCWEDKEPDGRWTETYPYRYVLRSGEIQERNATISVERREWRQRWLQWLPLFSKKSKSIDIHFDNEIGERTGSWKGGVVGTGYNMLHGESPLECLRRMESEHRFST